MFSTLRAHWVAQFIPEIDARALGWFRAALGCGLAWVSLSRDLIAVPVEQLRHRAVIDLDVVHRIAVSQSACDALQIVMLVGALLFAAGVLARWTYGIFVAAFVLSVLVTLERNSAHDLGLPLVTYLGWLTVPWDAGRIGSKSPPRTSPRSYGFAVWWPGLTLGLALLAAAYWKIHQSGLEWITGGAVKYHFVSDFSNAHVDWGLWIAVHSWAAVFFSFGAIVLETVFILNIFARGPWLRLAAGAVGALLYVSLYLLQGIYWPAWHSLFIAFLPWSLLNQRDSATTHTASTRPALRVAESFAVVTIVCVQLYASATGTEVEPVMSHFPMYAYTFPSIDEFEESMRPHMTRVTAAVADGRDMIGDLPTLVDDDRVRLIRLAESGDSLNENLSDRERRNRSELCERYQTQKGAWPAEIALTIERRGFDWSAGQFYDYQPVPTTPIRLAALCQHVIAEQAAR